MSFHECWLFGWSKLPKGNIQKNKHIVIYCTPSTKNLEYINRRKLLHWEAQFRLRTKYRKQYYIYLCNRKPNNNTLSTMITLHISIALTKQNFYCKTNVTDENINHIRWMVQNGLIAKSKLILLSFSLILISWNISLIKKGMRLKLNFFL